MQRSIPAQPPRRRRRWILLALAAGVAALAAGIATALGTPGAPTITAGPSGPTADATPTFSWSGEAGGSFDWDIAGTAHGETGTTATTATVGSPLADGDYTFRVRQVDDAQEAGSYAEREFRVDTTPPVGGSLSVPPRTATTTISVSAGAASDPSGPVTYALSQSSTAQPEAGAFQAALPTSFTLSSGDGPKGVHLWARDALGNAGVVASDTTVLDTTAPTGGALSIPPFTNSLVIPVTAAAASDDSPPVTYALSASGSVEPTAGVFQASLPTSFTLAGPDGAKTVHLWARDALGNAAAVASDTTVLDRVPPAITGATVPAAPNGQNDWFRTNVQVSFTCGPSGGTSVVACGPSTTLTGNTAGVTVTGTAQDQAGNTAQLQVGPIRIDKSPPPSPPPLSPGPGLVTNDVRPLFAWGAVTDVGPAGLAGYRLVVQTPAGAEVRQVAVGPGTLSHRLEAAHALPAGQYRWHVLAADEAGNVSPLPLLDDRTLFTVDPDATPAPVIAAGPSGVTNARQPTFAWVGSPGAVEYRWRILRGGQEVAAGTLAAPTSQVRIPQPLLQDGLYVFSVTQRLSVGVHGASAERLFVLDTVPPGVPEIVTRPPASSINAEPVFGWEPAEPGGAFQWQVLAFDGAPVQAGSGSARTVSLGPLPAGVYTFRVRQVDQAGNGGPFTVPAAFTVEAPPAPEPPGAPAAGEQAPSAGPQPTPAKIRPATLNAGRLSPRAGAVVRTLRPTLRWRAGPAGTRLYNVQVFVMEGASLRKVLSAFPRTTAFRVPAGRLRVGQRYVWRAWPYLRSGRFARAPIGTSFFDVERPLVSLERARILAPSAASARRGRALAVRWRAKEGAARYRVTVSRGAVTRFSRLVAGTRVRVPPRALAVAGTYRIVVREAGTVWAARPLSITR